MKQNANHIAYLLLISLLFTNAESDETHPKLPLEIKLKSGTSVRGRSVNVEDRNINEYLGIPYAEPPVGNLRFAAPVEMKSMPKEIDATKYKKACMQTTPTGFDQNNLGAKMWISNTKVGEDCLYLNIWVPEGSYEGANLPVMVWIYGGGFYSGSANLDVYNGSVLASTQNVIVVTIQYRLGAFGFLRIDPHMGHGVHQNAGVALGNQGIQDQLMGLRWVNENIEKFGGKKDNITLFGESAGAVSVSILWLANETRTLFTRAILESGSVLARWGFSTQEDAHKKGKWFAKSCGCNQESRNEIIECLQKKTEDELLKGFDDLYTHVCQERNTSLAKSLPQQYWKWKPEESMCLYFDTSMRPVLGGPLMSESIDAAFENVRDSPELLLGVNKNEGMYFLLYGLTVDNVELYNSSGSVISDNELDRDVTKKSLARDDFIWLTSSKFLDVNENIEERAKAVNNFYNLTDGVELSGKKLMDKLDQLSGDLDFICPTLMFADKIAQLSNSKVYVYSFERRTEHFPMPKWLGVMHGYEIEYVFGMPYQENFKKSFYTFTNDEKHLSDKVMMMWSNFARYGDPMPLNFTQKMKINWPKYEMSSTPSHQYLIINGTWTVSNSLKKAACQFWAQMHRIP